MNRTIDGKITIAVDALAISRTSAGSFTVLLGLMRELTELCDYDFVIYALCGDIEDKLGGYGGRIKYIYAPGWAKAFVLRCLWQQLVLPRLAKKAECRILYSASGYPELFTSLAVVSHQQNLWSFAKPQSWWPLKNHYKSLLRRIVAHIALRSSQANVFISDSIRLAANEVAPSTAAKNFTVHNAISRIDTEAVKPVDHIYTGEKFLLAVSSVVVHKNYLTLLYAFSQVAGQCPDLNLVVVGNYETKYGDSVRRESERLGLGDRVIFTGSLELGEIIGLYHKALFSINVSLLEGFGLAVLESFSAGCPVICSDIAAFREIGGGAVIYCDPQNPAGVAKKIMSLYHDRTRRKLIAKQSLERAKNFSWQKSARTLLGVFNMLLQIL